MARFVTRRKLLCKTVHQVCAPKTKDVLQTQIAGLILPHPLGLAAGLDKNAEAIDFMAACGFAWVETGTVTPGQGQVGNPRPRLYRGREDRAIVNCMGFNNRGVHAAVDRLRERRTRVPVGLNLGKAKVTPLESAANDYVTSLEAAYAFADYFTVNVSSPNTPGLRDLQDTTALRELLTAVLNARKEAGAKEAGSSNTRLKPLFLKIAPDLSQESIVDIGALAQELRVDAVICTNTTRELDLLSKAAPIQGGLSGAPLRTRANEVTRQLYEAVGGNLPIIGVGGIESADDAFERICSGATALQLYTSFVYQGPTVVRDIAEGLQRKLLAAGFSNMKDAVGSAIK